MVERLKALQDDEEELGHEADGKEPEAPEEDQETGQPQTQVSHRPLDFSSLDQPSCPTVG